MVIERWVVHLLCGGELSQLMSPSREQTFALQRNECCKFIEIVNGQLVPKFKQRLSRSMRLQTKPPSVAWEKGVNPSVYYTTKDATSQIAVPVLEIQHTFRKTELCWIGAAALKQHVRLRPLSLEPSKASARKPALRRPLPPASAPALAVPRAQ